MSIPSGPWSSSIPGAAGHQLVTLPTPVINAIANSDLQKATTDAAVLSPALTLTPYILGEECRGVWNRRSVQIEADPRDAVWVTRVIVEMETGAVVGRAGFHGRPDEVGMVEVGYSIDPLQRRKGHARAALMIMMDVARKYSLVKVIRASVSPKNWVSRKLVEECGFREAGEQWDEEDGLEIIFELPI